MLNRWLNTLVNPQCSGYICQHVAPNRDSDGKSIPAPWSLISAELSRTTRSLLLTPPVSAWRIHSRVVLHVGIILQYLRLSKSQIFAPIASFLVIVKGEIFEALGTMGKPHLSDRPELETFWLWLVVLKIAMIGHSYPNAPCTVHLPTLTS